MLCEYGCGLVAKYTLRNNKKCCSPHYNSCTANKAKNSKSLKKLYADGMKKKPSEVYNTLRPDIKSKMAWSKGKNIIPNEKLFCINSEYSTEYIKTRIRKDGLIEYKCKKCNIIDTWQGEPITLDLDHINGNNRDNRLDNLRFLCPNCHSQTPTYKGRNVNTGRTKISDDQLLESFKLHGNIRQALIKVGLVPQGANYLRLKKLLTKQ